VLGLYRMSDEAGQAFYLRSRGALADMLLWAIFRLQTRVFASNTYIKYALWALYPINEQSLDFFLIHLAVDGLPQVNRIGDWQSILALQWAGSSALTLMHCQDAGQPPLCTLAVPRIGASILL